LIIHYKNDKLLRREDSSKSSSSLGSYSESQIVDVKEPTFLQGITLQESSQGSSFDSYSASRIVDAKEPMLLPGSDSLASVEDCHEIIVDVDSPRRLRDVSSMGSQPSDGQLNTDFKFGGRPRGPQIASEPKQEKPMTLLDIIPRRQTRTHCLPRR
jgi:serine/arginine repetitive matrix protein 2